AVYIYRRSGDSWAVEAYVKAAHPSAGDNFGISVALSADGSTLAVGADLEDGGGTDINGNEQDETKLDAGAAYVFVRGSDAHWTQQAYVKASNTGAGDGFGRSVALTGDGNTLAVGAYHEDSASTTNQSDEGAPNEGAAYVFTRSAATWTKQAYVKPSAAIA